jgi:Beta-lactamase
VDEDRAIGHDALYQASGHPAPLVVPMIPSGGIYASAGDAARFIRFHLNGGQVNGKQILDRKYLDEMAKIPFPLTVFAAEQVDGYGLGLAINHYHGTRRHTHSGGGFGFLSDMIWYPDLALGIVLLTNSSSHRLQWWYANHILDQVLELPEYKARLGQFAGTNITAKDLLPVTQYKPPLSYITGQYIGRIPNRCWVEQDGNGFTIRFNWDKKPLRLAFYTPSDLQIVADRAYVINTANTPPIDQERGYQFIPYEDGSPCILIGIHDGSFFDYNTGPLDGKGTFRIGWYKYLGSYRAKGCVTPLFTSLCQKNGYLWLKISGCLLKLKEHQPGLFFTTTGEAVDFRGRDTMFAGVIMERIGLLTKMKFGLTHMRAYLNIGYAIVKARVAMILKRGTNGPL